jgi:hypothetical protein
VGNQKSQSLRLSLIFRLKSAALIRYCQARSISINASVVELVDALDSKDWRRFSGAVSGWFESDFGSTGRK